MAEENSAQLGISLPRYDGPFDLLLTLIRRREYGRPSIPRDALAAGLVRHLTGSAQRDYGGPLLAALALGNGRFGIQNLRACGAVCHESSAVRFSGRLRSLNAAIYRSEAAC